MTSIEKIKNIIKNLEEKEFYIYISAFFLSVLLFFAILFYWHSRRVNYWQKQLSELRKQRNNTKNLLEEFNAVEQDRQKVNEILQTGAGVPSFKIRGYYDDLVNQLSLHAYKSKEPAEPQTISLDSGEKERILTADFHNLNMKQVTDILKHIEDNPRVYAKKISIEKVYKDRPTLNISIEIATIEPSELKE